MSFKDFGTGPILVSIIWGILLSLVLVLLLYFLWKICKQEDRIHYLEQYKQTVTRSSQSHRQTNILVSYNSQQQQAEIPQDAQNINSNQQQPEVLQHYIPRKKQEIVTVETDDEDIDNIPTFETDRENKENIFYHEEDEVKLPAKILLTQDAISKHIDPKCFTDEDAIRKFKKREKRHGPTDVNTVFRVKPNEFYVARSSSHEEVIISVHPCQYWQCRKNKRGQLEVDERGTMNAIFSRHKDCHLLIEESRATRQNIVEVE